MTSGRDYKEKDLIGQWSWTPMILAQLLMIGFIGSGHPGRMLMFLCLGFAIAFAAILVDRRLFMRKAGAQTRIISLGFATAVTVALALLLGLGWVRALTATLLWICMFGGMVWAAWALKGQKIPVSHCAECGYETGPIDSMPDVCPECGSDWRQPGGVATERMKRHIWLAVPGAIVAGIAIVFFFPGGAGVVAPVMPTSLLVVQVQRSTFPNDRIWDTLQSRRLSQDQQLGLARALLERRASDRFPGLAQQTWLDTMGPTLPADLKRRYFEEMIVPRLEVTSSTRAGNPAQVILTTESRGHSAMRMPVLVIGAIEVDGKELVPAPEMVGSPHLTNSPVQVLGNLDPDAQHIRLRVWLIAGTVTYVPLVLRSKVEFDEEGIPLVPEGAEWVSEQVLEWRRK